MANRPETLVEDPDSGPPEGEEEDPEVGGDVEARPQPIPTPQVVYEIRDQDEESTRRSENTCQEDAIHAEIELLIWVTACQTPCITLLSPAPLWLWAPTNQRPSTGVW